MKEDTERTPLRTILTNFLNHIDTLENQRTPDNTYESEFQELKQFSESIKGTKQYSCSEGEKEVNRKKNRYKDILPFDVSRVVLNEYAGVPGSDYINANYIKGASGSPAYIASQGPLPHTVNDFWRMVVQCEVQVIVMACNEEEAGKHKCENYWVVGEGEEKQFGMVTLRLIKASTVCPDFSVRTMRLKYINTQSNPEERTVCQFHYSAWPDHGVPPLVRPLLDMVRLVRDTQASETLPVLIHCSAGCGRTGTICAIDYVWGLLRAGKLTKDFSLLSLVREMRKQRIAMVQTKEQYVLVHQAVRELFREQLRMIDSHPYENIDCNGLPLIKCPSPEPTYDSITYYQNNKSDEKQDEKEKEKAPPLPQKKRFQTLSSKQAKEVENLSERQRLVEQAGSSSESVTSTGSSGPRPRIATLRSLFERQNAERDTRQVSRSHSLGSMRPPIQSNTVEVKEPPVQKPIPSRGILRVPQTQPKPALPVKRSKSLRVLGTGDRCKLSIPPLPPTELPTDIEVPRRLSLESNYDIKDLVQSETTHQPLSDYLSVDSIVAGLGVRERRNSFRQAVRGESQESLAPWPKKPGLLRSYTSVDMRSAREKPNLTHDTPPTKPLLRPKPNLQTNTSGKMNEINKLSSDTRLQFRKPQSSPNKQFSALSELKKSQLQASSSRTLTTHSMSLRIAPKMRREDCRVLMPSNVSKGGLTQQSEYMYSSGESTMSGSSDQGFSTPKMFTSSTTRHPAKTQLNTKGEVVDVEDKDKPSVQLVSHQRSIFTSREHDIVNPVYHQDKSSHASSASRDTGHITRQHTPGRPEQAAQMIHQRMKSSSEFRKKQAPQNVRPVVYDSKGVRQNVSAIYGTVSKVAPPPYVAPGKNAQKPRSIPLSANDKSSNNVAFYDELYGKTQEQRHWQVSSSSRDMLPSSHSVSNKPNLAGTDVRLNFPETSGVKYSRNASDKRPLEQDYRTNAQDLYSSKVSERRPDGQDYKLGSQESQPIRLSDRRFQEQEGPLRNDRRPYDQDYHKNHQDSGSRNIMERRPMESTFRPNLPDSYLKTYNDRRAFDKSVQPNTQDPFSKSSNERREDLKSSMHDPYYRSPGEKRTVSQEYRQPTQEPFPKVGDRRQNEQDFRSGSQETFPSTNDRLQDVRSGVPDQYSNKVDRRPVPSYQPSSQELYSKNPAEKRPGDQDFHHSSQDSRSGYVMSRSSRPHDQKQRAPKTPAHDHIAVDKPTNESETTTHDATSGLRMRRGSRDDLALCANTPSRVKRHASVVLLRHSLIEGGNTGVGDPGSTPLSVWSHTTVDSSASQPTAAMDDPWSGAVGVDLDQVAASITSQKDGKMMRAALEALHLRKASQSTSKSSPHKGPQQTPKQSHPTLKSSQPSVKQSPATTSNPVDSSKTPGSPPQYQPPPETTKPGPFRKQQQYL